MDEDRRALLMAAAAAAGMTAGGSADAAPARRAAPRPGARRVKKIATEEGFSTQTLLEASARYSAAAPVSDPDRRVGAGPSFPGGGNLTDWNLRLKQMDDNGIDMQVLLVSSPGVQIFAPAEGAAIARAVNDEVSAQCKAHPTRFAFLAAIAPQGPADAAKEFERAVTTLGAKGAIINSSTKGEYLDDPKFWPIFEAAVALDAPIYIHPRDPAFQMLEPYRKYPGLSGAMWGYAAETSLHSLRLVLAGIFDRYPKLQIVIGHAGESIPFTLDRIDNRFKLTQPNPKLQRLPSEYFLSNFHITTSGINWAPTVRFCQDVMGVDRVLFAVDYPFEDTYWTMDQCKKLKLTPAEEFAFYQGNAERVFKIKA